jgi:hypothetical protein
MPSCGIHLKLQDDRSHYDAVANVTMDFSLLYRLDDGAFGIRVPEVSKIFSASSRPVMGPTQPPIQRVPGALSLGVKRPGRESDHTPPTSIQMENTCSYISTPRYVLMTGCLTN